MRNNRAVKDWRQVFSDDIAVSPHRYLWTGTIGADGQPLGDLDDAKTVKEMRSAVPYTEGECVYIAKGSGFEKVLIYRLLAYTRGAFHGERRETFKVQRLTREGVFSKVWVNTYPGQIQRGYFNAGLAPDCEGKL